MGRARRRPAGAPADWLCDCDCHVGTRSCIGSLCCQFVGKPLVGALPTSTSDEPIRAWKLADVAQVVTHSGRRLQFAGIGHSARYDVDDVASCGQHKSHRVPDVGCSCGFWALFDRPAAVGDEMAGYAPARRWLLEVELYGRVVRFERGYRAERQRMLAVTVPGQCVSCSDVGRFLVTGAPNTGEAIGAVCPTHAIGAGQRVTLAEVRAALGTEVSAPLLAPDDEALPEPPPPPERPAGDISEWVSALVFSTQGIAPRELFDMVTAGIVQRFQLPGANPAYGAQLEVQTYQGYIWLRFLDYSGCVLWQEVLRAGRRQYDPTDPTAISARP